MDFCVLGSGGRECGIVKSLINFNTFCISNFINKQIKDIVKDYIVVEDLYSINGTKDIILDKKPRLVVIGSEKFLESGLVDILKLNGIDCIGPCRKLADIEVSKIFARNFLKFNDLERYNPDYNIFYDYNNEAIEEIFEKFNYNFVIKDDGLCSGKGVRIYNKKNYKEGFEYANEILDNKNSDMPKKLLIEEKLIGKEFVLMSFCDGINIKHMPVVEDYKKIKLGSDINTGSMGCIIHQNHSLPFLTESDLYESQELNKNIMKILSKDILYKGILYGSFMKTEDGIKLIEYNARFGDPECLAVFSLLKTDLGIIFNSMGETKLNEIEIEYENKNVICKYLVPQGYPDNQDKNIKYELVDNEFIIQAGLEFIKDEYFLTGSRTLAVIQNGDDMEQLYLDIESTIEEINDNLFYRTDIGNPKEIIIDIEEESLYEKAGVNITEGQKVVDNIKDLVMSTYNEYVISNWGDFGGLYNISKYIKSKHLNNAILVNSMDGVGTKSILATEILGVENGLRNLGIDIVNHCVNDILVKGAVPLYFSDYVASGKISAENMVYVLEGMTRACIENNMVLIGGETAEMPDVYNDLNYDIVGNINGIVEKKKMINGKKSIKKGDILYGILSEGPQTNGYTLIRNIIRDNPELLKLENIVNVHKSFLNDITEIQKNIKINGLVHITGGGYYENIPRVLPDNLGVEIKLEILEPFKSLMDKGNISRLEMLKVFNCGYGMIVFTNPQNQKYMSNKYKYLGIVTERNGDQIKIN